ncbi:MAG: sterol desaturase family protein [Saprospiraceae bacterium]|nr:sterol desaturase family protein [Saprospiraceae bacterium]
MNHVLETILNAYGGYASYLFHEITHPSWHNYFYWLILVSLFFFSLEWWKPWRENQPKFRKDFWLDFFYMFFNFFLFSLVIYNAASHVFVDLFNNIILYITGFDLQASNPMNMWPLWSVLLVGFIVRDFVQWWVHRLLHRFSFLWNFHKVHHSVEQMGFAAHLRYHWMETIVYRSIEYIPLALLGIGLYDFFIIHIFTLAVGHYNHSNITVSGRVSGGIVGFLIGLAIVTGVADISVLVGEGFVIKGLFLVGITLVGIFILGPFMKKIFNSPEMHIWHHAYEIPKNKPYGINFGITLAIWDYIFGTAVIPHDGRDIKLGFPGMEDFPQHFGDQFTYGLKQEK